jgi:hypothetical protein
MNIYYVYQYVRDDQTPYYIGKGKDDRAWKSHRRSNGAEIKPKDINRIQILTENLTEKEAWDLEIELIAKYGLKSEGGILVNMKEGGQGGTPSQEMRDHMSRIMTGRKKPPRTETHKKNLSESCQGVLKPRSKEHQDAWTAASTANWANNTERKKQVSAMGQTNKGRKHTPEALEKKRVAMKAYWAQRKLLQS